jgi:hypothetical protein
MWILDNRSGNEIHSLGEGTDQASTVNLWISTPGVATLISPATAPRNCAARALT